ncbi:MAG: hypothetical protein KDD61_10625 [Bdellovibrionales bacterium]|nr:hypothetical protein [Bdellovibrionales bacterium]
MKFKEFEEMAPLQRRQFLKVMGTVLALPFTPKGVQQAVTEVLFGEVAYAEAFAASQANFFIEINLRDQFDFGHIAVAPGLAQFSGLKRGAMGHQLALFDDPSTLMRTGNRFYLTREGRALAPHVSNIAILELCELSMGTIHGHEAANAIRSPGRSYSSLGRPAMWTLDQPNKQGGNEYHYSNVPTPGVLHNYYMKQLSPSIRNGVIYKGISREIHTVYHHAGHLQNAQPNRHQTISTLINTFNGATQTQSTFLADNANLITRLLKKIDERHLNRLRYERNVASEHGQEVTALESVLIKQKEQVPINIALTPQERSYWSSGVSGMGHGTNTAQIWEQCGLAVNILKHDLCKTVILEFDHGDIHGDRSEAQLRAQGTQAALPLARMIEQLKAAGIFDRTLIAMYTTDGGRAPHSDSWGDQGKNGVILAGGMIKGGYYGDIRVAGNIGNGHFWSYHIPDASGNPIAQGTTGNASRVSGASIWKTVARAMGVPESVYGNLSELNGAPYLNYLLRS